MNELLFHSVVLAHHLYVLKYLNVDFGKIPVPEVQKMQELGPRYFTSWNLVIQAIYFTIALVTDILEKHNIQNHLRKLALQWRGYIFATLFMPWTIFVFCMFWGLHAIDKNWVVPPGIDGFIPEWLNHAMHTNILIFMIIEAIGCNQQMPTFSAALKGNVLVTIMYDFVLFATYFERGTWLYGIYDVLSWSGKIIFTIFSFVIVIFLVKMVIMMKSKSPHHKIR